jgi:hypothetical protein
MKLAIEKARADIRGEGFSKATQGVRVSIHLGESQRFMRQVLQGGEWVQRVMRQGLYPAFQQEPGRYREKNNRSALQNLSVVRSKVAEWMNQGAVMQLAELAWCTNPLSVATKRDTTTGQDKHRVVLDLSRHVNKCMEKFTVKMDDLVGMEGLRKQGDYMTVFDLENQFFHVQLAPAACRFFGFAVPDEQGIEKFYCFTVMVYGYAPAVAVVTRMVRPVVSFAHKLGIRTSIFVDDGLAAGDSKQEAESNTELVLELFQWAGWNIQWKKTSTEAQQRVRYLGVEVDTENMEFRLPEDKLKDIEVTLDREIGRGLRKEGSEKKEAAELLGKLAACRVTHGEVLHIMTRAAQHQLGVATLRENWEGKLLWDKDAVRELQKVRENLRYYNGRNIREEEKTDKKYAEQDTKRAREHVRRSASKRTRHETGENCSLIFTARKQCEQVTDWEPERGGWIEEGLDEL